MRVLFCARRDTYRAGRLPCIRRWKAFQSLQSTKRGYLQLKHDILLIVSNLLNTAVWLAVGAELRQQPLHSMMARTQHHRRLQGCDVEEVLYPFSSPSLPLLQQISLHVSLCLVLASTHLCARRRLLSSRQMLGSAASGSVNFAILLDCIQAKP